MMRAKTVKAWYQVHKWTSLICTAFLLLLCITGLPLIFYHEIDHLTGNAVEAPVLEGETGTARLDSMVETARAQMPDRVVQFISWDQDEPELLYVAMAPELTSHPDDTLFVALDNRTGEVLGQPNFQEGVMWVFYKLHVDLYAGLAGKLFLGFMGLLFVAAIISGVVLYGPFMRKLDFGTVRKERTKRLKWLDVHNLLGAVTLVWVLVVGATGVINTWADLVLQAWRFGQLAELTEPYKDLPIPAADKTIPVDDALAVGLEAAPGMLPAFIAFPGYSFTSNHHYAVFMYGDTPLTSKLLKPALVDAESGEITAIRPLPWYVTALLVSQPLHFGDYGGMPLKIIWAILDILTIVVLGSGLYLWVTRRSPVEARIAAWEAENDAAPVLARGGAE